MLTLPRPILVPDPQPVGNNREGTHTKGRRADE